MSNHRFITQCTSQYDSTCRGLAQECLDLAMLIRRIDRAARFDEKSADIRAKALKYCSDHGLAGSVLRMEEAVGEEVI